MSAIVKPYGGYHPVAPWLQVSQEPEMEHLLTTVATHVLIVVAEFAVAKLLHYVWVRVTGAPAVA